MRWAEWAALSPFFRLHGSVLGGVHTPWSYDDETVAIYKRLSRLHLAARPLIRRLWKRAERTGIPITRPLWLAYPDDPAAAPAGPGVAARAEGARRPGRRAGRRRRARSTSPQAAGGARKRACG